jgi:hypothetical protein
VTVLLFVVLTASACGGDSTNAASIGPSSEGGSSADADPSTQVLDSSEVPSDIAVCDLLTDEQVATVLPGHSGGMEVASGQELLGSSASYKCAYDVERGDEVDIFTVDLTVGPDAVQWFEAGRAFAREENDILRELDIGDGGYVEAGSGPLYDFMVVVLKDSVEIDLTLKAQGAEDRVDALVALAPTVVSKLY